MDAIPFGSFYAQEAEDFGKRHPILGEKLRLLLQTSDKIFSRQNVAMEKPDSVVYSLGRVCAEEFGEILLLCGNGFGIGGMKLLRGLYERAITSAFIAQNPEQAESFLEYHHIHQGKLVNHAKDLFDDISQLFSPEQMEEIQKSYQQAKGKFLIPDCERCGTTRLNHTWSRLDTASMSRKVGGRMDQFYLIYFLQPTMQVHATVYSLVSRMTTNDKDGLPLNNNERQDADRALRGAHHIVLFVLNVQNSYFKLSLAKELQERQSDYQAAWA
jgi:Family of unknown function (DUF5677)